MVTPVPPNAAHADQVPTIGTAVETERERLVALGVRRRGVVLGCAGSRAEGEPAEAAQVTPVGRREIIIRMPSRCGNAVNRGGFEVVLLGRSSDSPMLRYDAQCVRFRFNPPAPHSGIPWRRLCRRERDHGFENASSDDKSRLNSRVFPSGPFSRLGSLTTSHVTQQQLFANRQKQGRFDFCCVRVVRSHRLRGLIAPFN
jgi:hypothetical protein